MVTVTQRLGKLVTLATLTALLFWFFPAFEAPAGALNLTTSALAADIAPGAR